MNTPTILKYHLEKYLFRQNIKEQRLIIAKLSELTGYHKKTLVSQWSRIPLDEKRSIPEQPFQIICDYFGVTMDEMRNY